MNNPIGHLTSSFGITHAGTVVSGNESWNWDTMGRLQGQMQCTPATCGSSGYNVYATYDLVGNQTSVWDSSVALYPIYDGANRLAGMTASFGVEPGGQGPGSQTLISISAHSPFGGLTNATLGNGLAETRGYNSRGWLGNIYDQNGGTTVYSLTGSATGSMINYAGNGSVLNASDSNNGNWTYTYDGVDRIQTAALSGGTTISYTDDTYGNMTCTATNGVACTPLGLTFNASNNQINDGIRQYDANGNLTTDGLHGYVYDAENRVTCVKGTDGTCTSSTATVYYYDAGGRRVAKYTGAGTVIEEHVYDLKGDQSSVHDGSGNLLRAELYDPDGRHVATWKNSALTYNLADWLGTERVRTSSSATVTETCKDTPYGMNLACAGSDTSPMHFTGKQLDSETGNTHFDARELATGINLGRWMTPDWSADGSPVPYAKLDNPQTLNLYVYLRNNPLNTVDPDGHGADENNPATEKPCTGTGCPTLKPVSSVTILGQKVDVNYVPGMSNKDQLAASGAITAAAAAINSNADKLSANEKAAIGQISTVTITDSHTAYLGATGNHTMTLSIGYLTDKKLPVTAAWLGSLFGHEGQHYLNSGKYTGAERWKDEQSARRMQLAIGNKIGFLQYETQDLERRSDDSHADEMQKSMENGFTD